MVKRTPQEKKALSYKKDRRNILLENDKASRRLIPLQKARVHRTYRKKVNEALQEVITASEGEQIELAESKTAAVKRGSWKKYPDVPLKEALEKQLERRETHAGNGKSALKRQREFVSNLKIEIERETDGRWIAKAIGMNGVAVYGDTREKALEKCKALAGAYFLEEIGAGKVLRVGDTGIEIETY